MEEPQDRGQHDQYRRNRGDGDDGGVGEHVPVLSLQRGPPLVGQERVERGLGRDAEQLDLRGESGILADLAAPEQHLPAVLDEQRYAGAVRADEAEAAAIGIRGVPFFVVDRTYGINGAQPADVLLQALERAWAERSPLISVDGGAAGACGPDGCAV